MLLHMRSVSPIWIEAASRGGLHSGVAIVSEYGKRTAPVAAKALSPEALARWRSRARTILHPTESDAGHEAAAESDAPVPHAIDPHEDADDAAQRRHAIRQKTLIGAQVVFNDLMSTYNCTVRDLSETGARVKLNAPVQVPQAFMLRFSDGRVRQCKVRRRNALELGIEFLD
jgi:hypothetical protein